MVFTVKPSTYKELSSYIDMYDSWRVLNLPAGDLHHCTSTDEFSGRMCLTTWVMEGE